MLTPHLISLQLQRYHSLLTLNSPIIESEGYMRYWENFPGNRWSTDQTISPDWVAPNMTKERQQTGLEFAPNKIRELPFSNLLTIEHQSENISDCLRNSQDFLAVILLKSSRNSRSLECSPPSERGLPLPLSNNLS